MLYLHVSLKRGLAKQSRFVMTDSMKLPSHFQIGDKAMFLKYPENEMYSPIPCKILSVRFYEPKVKYDIELELPDGFSRIYNVDSYLLGDE